MVAPKNGMYMTPADFVQFQDDFTDMLSPEQMVSLTGNDKSKGNCEVSNTDTIVKNVTFVVTEKCNLACTYCYETHKTNTRMTKETAKAAVDLIFNQEKLKGYYDLWKTPAIVLDFIGGEPLLEIDLMDYIVEYFKFKAFEMDHPWQHNYMISISSNGTLYLSKKVQRFLKRNPGRVSMTISIDGNKDLHDACRVYRNGKGSYDIVERSVKQWVKDNDGRVQTKSTIAPANIKFMVESFRHLFENLGVVGGLSNWIYEKGWSVDDSRLGYENLKKLAEWLLEDERYSKYYLSYFDPSIGQPRTQDSNFCGGNGDMLAFSAAGKATPCLRFLKYTLERQEEQICGDVWDGLESKQENEWLNRLKGITMSSQSPPKCQACPVTTGCGGCTAYNYDYTGNPDRKATFSCKMHRSRVLANVFYWNTLYRKLNIGERVAMNMPINWALEIISEEEYWMLHDLAKVDY